MKRGAAPFLFCFLSALPAAASPVEVSAVPHLGPDAPACDGWLTFLIRLRATTGESVSGTVEITDGDGTTTRAPFATSTGERMALELPYHDSFSRGLEVIARDGAGKILSREPVRSPRSCAPFLFDITPDSRLPLALRDARITPEVGRLYVNPGDGLELAVSRVMTDERTGEPLLPATAMGYASATVVSVRSEVLVGLTEDRFAALSSWVKTGGVVAVTVGRAEDLQKPRLAALVGDGVTSSVMDDAARFVAFEVVSRATPAAAPVADGGPTTLPLAAPAPNAPIVVKVPPGEAVRAALLGFSGGRLSRTRFGARAPLGMGEVHLLAFDPSGRDFVDDRWVRHSMAELVRLAWDRSTRVAITGGGTPFEEGRLHGIRSLLDPNEAGGWAVSVAAAVLLLYALVAIPVTFRRAAQRNRPLAALYELPLWSAVTLALIVAIGAVSKGGRARARRVSIVECASGSTDCGIVRFRGLFASSSDAMRIRSTSPTGLLDVAGGSSDHSRILMVEREGARIDELHGRPWETLLLREDDTVGLVGTVTLSGDGRDVEIVNGLPRALVGVVARAANGDFHSFPRIEPGARVALSSGRSLGSPSSLSAPGSVPLRPRPARSLEAYRFMSELDGAMPGLGGAWTGVEPLMRNAADVWPDRSAALIACIEGWDQAATDSDLPVEKTWTLLRVVATEAAP